MTKLKIATDLALPIEAVTEAMGFLGRRGSGKTYAAQRLAEEFHRAKAQFVVLDPVGNWWALRLAADGESPGIPVPVFGGLHGDVPLEPAAGKLIADTIVDRAISAVIDVSQFESDADKARFARAFAERFYYRKKSAPSAVHLFLEEAQEFIPQNPTRDEPLMLHAFTRLAKLGRNFGIGISMLSQRPQEVNKKVINLAELLLVFQLTGVHERKAVEAWISDKGIDGEDIEAELPKLERGHPHAWSPAWLGISRVIDVAEKWTFDASSTPKSGTATVARELSPIDLEKLRTDMASAIERAKADDPKELRKRIAELEREKKQAEKQHAGAAPRVIEKPVVDQAAIDRAVGTALANQVRQVNARNREAVRSGKAATTALERSIGLFTASIEGTVLPGLRTMVDALEVLVPVLGNGNGGSHTNFSATAAITSTPRREPPAQPRRVISTTQPSGSTGGEAGRVSGSASITKSNQRIIDALAFYESTGVETPTRGMLATFCGKTDGGSWSARLSEARSAGLIADVEPGRVRLTDEGRAAADTTTIPRSLEELHQRWLNKMPGSKQREALRILLDIYPESISRAELAERVGAVDGGSWSARLSEMRAPGVLEDVLDQKGHVRASAALFPEGLR